jgi:hypothetical protein
MLQRGSCNHCLLTFPHSTALLAWLSFCVGLASLTSNLGRGRGGRDGRTGALVGPNHEVDLRQAR